MPGFSTRALSPSRWTGRSDLTLTASTWRPARPSPAAAAGPPPCFSPQEQLPFFAGTYFPPTSRGGLTGLRQLLSAIRDAWAQDREALTAPGRQFLQLLTQRPPEQSSPTRPFWRRAWPSGNGPMMRHTAASAPPPNFPWGTVLLFLLTYGEKKADPRRLGHGGKNSGAALPRGHLRPHRRRILPVFHRPGLSHPPL